MQSLTDILETAVEHEVDLEAVCGWPDTDSEAVEGLYDGDLSEAVDDGWHEMVVGAWSKAELETLEGWMKADPVVVVGWPDLDSDTVDGWCGADLDVVGG